MKNHKPLKTIDGLTGDLRDIGQELRPSIAWAKWVSPQCDCYILSYGEELSLLPIRASGNIMWSVFRGTYPWM